ncbi:MAG: hypothetical protein HOI53_08520, partial [Francisellaceae bacterium]|nr:hypothetical protein [Francisellaceae bacterium]
MYNQNFLNENRLCALRNHVTSAALDNPNGVPEYMNIVRLTRTFEIKGQSVSALDFITKNTMDPSYDEKAPCDTLDFGNGSATYTALQTAFHTEFNKDLPSLIDLIAAWKTTYSNEQERRNLELSFLKPTNIENVAYKFQEVFAYKNAPLWSYIQNSSGSVRTGQFMADPRLAKYMLESLMQCQPDSLLLSILSSIEEELTPKTPRETKSDKDKRQEACSTLSKVCDALQKYYNDSNQQANLSASFGDIANPDSAMGFLSPAAGLPGDILQKFGRLSGGEKAISLIGALVLGRAVGHNFPKINAGIKTAIVASLGAPMLAHLGTKFMYGRSYMEVRKIKALLGGNNSKNPQQVIARICGFSLEEAKTPGVVNSMEGFIDSIVGNEVFASLPFRDVIMTFAPRDSDTAVLISASSSSAVLGALTAYPQIKSSLELVIPQLINKYEAKDQNPYEKAKFHIALSSSRTWVEGMHFLMSNSAEIDNLLAQDDMETPVTAQPTIENRTKVVTDDTNVTIPQMGIDHRVEDHISAKRPEYLQTHINQKISSLSRLSGHYHSAYFREVNAHDDINGITNGINVTTDGTFIYASFQIANADLTEANLKALYEKVKSILPPRNSNPASLKLVFAGSDEDEDGNSTPLLAGFSWIREGQTPAYNYESDEIDDIHDQQLVSMDNNVFGNRVLRLYTNVFRGETE